MNDIVQSSSNFLGWDDIRCAEYREFWAAVGLSGSDSRMNYAGITSPENDSPLRNCVLLLNGSPLRNRVLL